MWFLQAIEVKFQLCCTGLGCVGLLRRSFRVYEGLGCTVGVMHYVLHNFCNFDRMALPAYTGVLYLSFFIVCAAWLRLLTLWMLAVETHSFSSSRIWVLLVGIEWCVYRILGSGILVLLSLLPYICEERLFFYVPQLLQVCHCCAYDQAVLVLCMPVAGYWLFFFFLI